MTSRKEHWNAIYEESPIDTLGWYEEAPDPSLRFIAETDLSTNARFLDAGAGATTLIDHLLHRGYTDLVVVDISEVALRQLRDRLNGTQASCIEWIVGDLTHPGIFDDIEPVDLWHDRAVLHFLTEQEDRAAYIHSLRSILKPGGYVVIAAFSLEGADRCSGLEVRNYDERMIADLLGEEFTLIDHFDYLYRTPGGDSRPYVYTLFRRKNDP